MKLIRSAITSLCLLAGGAQASEPTLLDISNWLNGIETMTARFKQYNDDGSLSAGTLYIRRPGRMRMEYDNQDALLVVSASNVQIFEHANDTQPISVPLRRTPLWNILRKDVDLGRPGAIKSLDHYRDLTRITAYDDNHPEAGRMVLEFDNSRGTVNLHGWVIRTGAGETIKLRLENPEYGIPLSNFLFTHRPSQK